MPLYEYKCKECAKVFEVIQHFSDAPLATHEGCGGQVERLLSAPALQFKGSGWYVTDYARGGSATKSTSDSSSNGSSANGTSGSEKKSESKSTTSTTTSDKK